MPEEELSLVTVIPYDRSAIMAASKSADTGVGIFNDSEEEGTARERVLRILRGFRLDNAIPPVEIVEGQHPHRYKLTHGAHRFYCSLAAGFTSVPTIEGFDWHR